MTRIIKSIFLVLTLVFASFTLTACMVQKGESAYDIAVKNGFKGSEKEWLESLTGKDGKDGESMHIMDIYEETKKNKGENYTFDDFLKEYFKDANIHGKSAYEIAVEQGYEGTEEEWLASLKGATGPKGEPGDSIDLYETYLSLVEKGEVTCSFLDFVQEYLNVDLNNSLKSSVAHAMLSAVSIFALDSPIDNINTNGVGFSGSGVIYQMDDKGNAYIITNYHVLYDTDNKRVLPYIYIMLYGYESGEYAIPATFVGGSATYDIAVIKVVGNEVLANSDAKVADVFDSNDIVVGQTAIAIGNPQGSGISVSDGIVSVDSETIDMSPISKENVTLNASGKVSMRVIRIDTPVNPGNSGGGLFDENGYLIGIVNAKIINSNVENIGYAIPSNIATFVAQNIIDNCNGTTSTSVIKCLMGLTISPNSSKGVYDEATGTIKIIEEIKVVEVSSNSVANGILQAEDILVSMSLKGRAYEITRNFIPVDLCLNARTGDTVEVTVLRDGQLKTFSFTFGQGIIVG